MLPIRRVLMCLVAGVNHFRCPSETVEAFKKFQETFTALKQCEKKGFIQIRAVKKEDVTGKHLPIEIETTPVNVHGIIYLEKLNDAH